MGSMHFTRCSKPGDVGRDVRTVTFDSSPDYTLPRKFGWHGPTMRYHAKGTTAKEHTWHVYAAQTEEGRPAFVGVLTQKTRETIRRELAQY